MNLLTAFIVFSSALLIGCPSQPIRMAGVTTLKKPGVINISAGWVKDKDKKFDAELIIQNESKDNPLLVFVGDMSCARGGVKGQLNIEGNPRILDIRPTETRHLILKCNVGSKNKGDFTITFNKVFENPKQDSQTPGKVIAENLVWKQGESEGPIQY